jgi:glutaminyl-peptide cyclotransferase
MRTNSFCSVAAAAVFVLLAGCGAKTQSAAPTAFDGGRSYDLLKKQCSFGPRYAGVPGHKACADFIKTELAKTSDQVIARQFDETIRGKALRFQNIFGVFNPDAKRFILLCAHWDTRPEADREIDPVKQKKPILGANDGASGVAVLLEMARNFHDKNPKVGVVMAFFDGEDYGPGEADMYVGSRHFAQQWKTDVRPKGREISYDYGILLDMVGDKDLDILRESTSVTSAPAVVERVWSTAKRLGHSDAFKETGDYAINDDHVPLIFGGIKCIDVIDFNYGPWHTLDDTPDKCSAKSLQTVGEVIESVIYDESPEPK